MLEARPPRCSALPFELLESGRCRERMAAVITVRCPTARPQELAEADPRPGDLAAVDRPPLAKAAVAATVDGHDGRPVTPAAPTGPRWRSSPRTPTRARACCATPRPTCSPRPCCALWPGAHYAIGPVIADGFYYDFELPGGAHVQRRRPRARSRRRCATSSPRTSPSCATSTRIDEGLALFADQPFKREIIEAVGAPGAERGRRRPQRPGAAEVSAPTGTRRRPFTDLCRGPARPVDGAARALQADAGGRRLLARRREPPPAPAHLRHGLGVGEGPGRAPAPPRGGRATRPPQARRRARPVLVSPTRSDRGSPSSTPRAGPSAG